MCIRKNILNFTVVYCTLISGGQLGSPESFRPQYRTGYRHNDIKMPRPIQNDDNWNDFSELLSPLEDDQGEDIEHYSPFINSHDYFNHEHALHQLGLHNEDFEDFQEFISDVNRHYKNSEEGGAGNSLGNSISNEDDLAEEPSKLTRCSPSSSSEKENLHPDVSSLIQELIQSYQGREINEDDGSVGILDRLMELASIYDIDVTDLFLHRDGYDSGMQDKGHHLPIIKRRKRSPQPRRTSSSSRSSSRGSSSRSSGSSGSGSSSGSSSSGSRWTWGSRNSPSSSSSSSSSNTGTKVATGTAVLGGAAIGGAAIASTGGSSTSLSKPSAPPYPGTSPGSSYPASGNTAGAPYPTNVGKPTAGAPYPTSGNTAGAPYPTSGNTAGAPYPTSGNTAGAPYPTSGNTAGAPYPTYGNTAKAPYPTSGNTAGAPYPTYPAAGSPYPSSSVPYPPMGGRPTGYPTAGVPYPPSGSYPGNYPRSYPGYPSSYPGSYPGGGAISSSNYGSRHSGFSNQGYSSNNNFPQAKKTKSKKVKDAVKLAIQGYALHKVSLD